MKPSLVSIGVLSVGLAFAASPARADDPSQPPVPPAAPPAGQTSPADGTQAPRRHHMRGYDLADLTQKLGLSADQQKTVGGFIADGRSQAKALRDDDTLAPDDKRAKMREIMKATKDQIRGVLTPDQQKIFDAIPERGDRPPQSPPPAPPQSN
jgi:hypothetical protein